MTILNDLCILFEFKDLIQSFCTVRTRGQNLLLPSGLILSWETCSNLRHFHILQETFNKLLVESTELLESDCAETSTKGRKKKRKYLEQNYPPSLFAPSIEGNCIILINDSSAKDEKSILEFIAQEMIALNEEKYSTSTIKPDKVYQDFSNYVMGGNELASSYYEKIINILKIVESKFSKG